MDYKDYSAGLTQEHFWFKGKEKLIDLLGSAITPSAKILCIGAGTGEDLQCLKKYGDIYAIDIDTHALQLIPDDLVYEKRQADACAMPYAEESFDAVVAFDVIEHIQDDQKAVGEIFRVLKKGGRIIFTVPAFNFLFSNHDTMLHHYRRYNKKMARRLFKNFSRISLGYWFFFLFIPAASIRLMRKSASSSSTILPGVVNKMIYGILLFEVWLIKMGMRFPFGLTLYGIFEKEK